MNTTRYYVGNWSTTNLLKARNLVRTGKGSTIVRECVNARGDILRTIVD